jgi:ubiquitin-protein ligase
MIQFECPKCHVCYEVDDDLAGARVACSECDTHFYVPVPMAEGSPPPPAEEPAPRLAEEPSAPPEGMKAASSEEDTESVADTSGKLNLSAEFAEFVNSETPPPLPSKQFSQSVAPGAESPYSSPTPVIPSSPSQKQSPRQRRLASDSRMMQECFTTFPLIHLERAQGNPPELYVVSYRIRGIERLQGDRVVFRDYHEVEIKLPGTYPRTPPTCRMLTPIFHPNIEPAIICIGDHWTASERLCDLVVRIGEMIAYQAHNIKSPLDGEAAMWTDLHGDMLPIDNRDLTPPDL